MSVSPANSSPVPASALGWNALPESYRIPEAAPSLADARAYCERLAKTHYENFSVATWFLPAKLRQHFYNVYAYCRISDDLGDEVGDAHQSLELLDLWEEELNACYAGSYPTTPTPGVPGTPTSPRHPVFVALAETVKQCGIPKHEFADLLIAFRQDQTIT
ncbi:MAG: squalene/phytoene synthase family protein, partial [Terriglobales bacterium]